MPVQNTNSQIYAHQESATYLLSAENSLLSLGGQTVHQNE